jgi:hypothetical protein
MVDEMRFERKFEYDKRMIPKKDCLHCGKLLPPDQKWCPRGCFRAWYLERHPDYRFITPQPRKRRKLASPLTGAMAEIALWEPGKSPTLQPMTMMRTTMAKSECARCHIMFSSVSSFDKHLRWRDTGLVHVDPAEIPELRQRDDGIWTGKPLDSSKRARLRAQTGEQDKTGVIP